MIEFACLPIFIKIVSQVVRRLKKIAIKKILIKKIVIIEKIAIIQKKIVNKSKNCYN